MTVIAAPAETGIRWGRIVLGAFLLELALFASLIPIGVAFGLPSTAPGAQPVDATVFFTSVPVGCLVLGFFFGMWVARDLAANVVGHGALVGIIATMIYLGICTIPPNTIAAVVAMYGAPLFLLVNGLRVAGCIAGAWYQGTRRSNR
jgi:hypothetical protein